MNWLPFSAFMFVNGTANEYTILDMAVSDEPQTAYEWVYDWVCPWTYETVNYTLCNVALNFTLSRFNCSNYLTTDMMSMDYSNTTLNDMLWIYTDSYNMTTEDLVSYDGAYCAVDNYIASCQQNMQATYWYQ